MHEGSVRSIYKYVNSGGSFGANPLEQTVGLGSAETIESLEVFWPTSGTTQTLRNLKADQAIRVVEGQDQFVRLAR
jgi:hypothetical protein